MTSSTSTSRVARATATSWPSAIAVAWGVVIAIVIGIPALRVRGLYLGVITLGFSLVVSTWVLQPRLPEQLVQRAGGEPAATDGRAVELPRRQAGLLLLLSHRRGPRDPARHPLPQDRDWAARCSRCATTRPTPPPTPCRRRGRRSSRSPSRAASLHSPGACSRRGTRPAFPTTSPHSSRSRCSRSRSSVASRRSRAR